MIRTSFPIHSKTLGEVVSTFSQVLVVNLDRRKDRWDLISAHLMEQGVRQFERIAGVDGRLESNELCKRVLRLVGEPKEEVTSRQKGVVGCLKGHREALKVASCILKNEEDRLLILEDDAFFIEGAAQLLEDGLNVLPKSWNVLMLGGIYNTAPGIISGSSKVVRVWNVSATHAYVVNKKSCSLLIQHIERVLESSLIIPVDEIFIHLQSKNEFYALNPLIVGQRSGEWSDIQGTEVFHSQECFKLGVEITWKVRLWMMARPYLVFVKNSMIECGSQFFQYCCRRLPKKNFEKQMF